MARPGHGAASPLPGLVLHQYHEVAPSTPGTREFSRYSVKDLKSGFSSSKCSGMCFSGKGSQPQESQTCNIEVLQFQKVQGPQHPSSLFPKEVNEVRPRGQRGGPAAATEGGPRHPALTQECLLRGGARARLQLCSAQWGLGVALSGTPGSSGGGGCSRQLVWRLGWPVSRPYGRPAPSWEAGGPATQASFSRTKWLCVRLHRGSVCTSWGPWPLARGLAVGCGWPPTQHRSSLLVAHTPATVRRSWSESAGRVLSAPSRTQRPPLFPGSQRARCNYKGAIVFPSF